MERDIIFKPPKGGTPLDPDEIEGLKLQHILTKAELDRWEQDNINDAYSWLSRRKKKKDVLSKDFLVKLHQRMFGKVWSWAGSFRRSDKNIGVEWTTIPIALRQLLEDTNYWIKHDTYPSDEIAVRLHHKLVWIHPFPNGNGRHSRLFTDVLVQDIFDSEPFSWGSANLNYDGNVRQKYIQSLRLADNHEYTDLINFVRS